MKIEDKVAENLFIEAIAHYSHFHDRGDLARVSMNIAAVEKQEDSDVNSRYFQMHDELESKRRKFVQENAESYAVSN